MGIYILVFQLCMVVLYGIFIRTSASETTDLAQISSMVYFILGAIILIQPSPSPPSETACTTGTISPACSTAWLSGCSSTSSGSSL